MATTAVRRERSGMSESGPEPGWFVGLLLRRRGVVLLVALLLMALAGVAGRDAGDKLVSGAYLDPSAESQQAAELLTHQFPGDPPNLVLIVETTTGTLNSSEVAQSGRALTEHWPRRPESPVCSPTGRHRTRRCAAPTTGQPTSPCCRS